MFACYGGDRFWPLTADVAVFHAPLDRTVRALRPGPRRRWWPRRTARLSHAIGRWGLVGPAHGG